MNCQRAGCPGVIVDGYCDDCGLAPRPAERSDTLIVHGQAAVSTASSTSRPRTTATTATRTSMLGAGIVHITPVPPRDPETVVMADPTVAEHRRFCRQCDEPVGRTREGRPGRTEGFCGSCGTPFSFVAKLARGDVVAGQYEVAGCLAHGGLGWIYLARDRNVSDRWVVLKGLLDTGDQHAVAAALSERRFLAEVKHPNIVKIHNFVEHRGDGYIVMEFVNGISLRGMLEERRAANDGRHVPLPVTEAIAYCIDILPALGHLHEAGLVFCDFKPDNVIQSGGTLTLIDLGGVYRMSDRTSPVYGTTGYQAPEIADTGPSITSDLFTVGRTLAVLCTDFAGYQSTYRYTLPSPHDVPLYAQYDSLYRFLQRATALDPAARFQSADEMAGQLKGVLREIVAAEKGAPVPGPSTRFTPPGRAATDANDWRALPTPLVHPDDPRSTVILALAAYEPDEIIRQLDADRGSSVETDLWLARLLIDAGRLDEASVVLSGIDSVDPWEWRAVWYRALLAMAAGSPAQAEGHLTDVYQTLPGELAPKLALGMVAESTGDAAAAARWYEIVCRTDTAFTSAAFGLARCLAAVGDRPGAVAALELVPDTSSDHVDAQVAEAELLLDVDWDDPCLADVVRAASIVERVPLPREQRDRLSVDVLERAHCLIQRDPGLADGTTSVLGHVMTDRDIRIGLERSLRLMARHAATAAERVALIDRANTVRPRSLL